MDTNEQREQLEKLMEEYGTQLLRMCAVYLRDADLAQDAVQDTFIKAWLNIDYFRGEAKMSTWLHRIALNECLTFLNKRQANTQLSIDDIHSEMTNSLETDPYFDGDETQRIFLKAVHTLPEKQQMVFNLKYFKEMKYEEISQILGTSIGALKASYHHAVKKIESFLKSNS